MWSRRAFLGSLAIGGAGGCTSHSDDAYSASLTDVQPSSDTLPNSARIEIAHWFSPGLFEAVGNEYIDSGQRISLRDISYEDRESLESSIAEAIVGARPPELFQTVLGEELRRYARVSEIHPIPDIVDDEVRLSMKNGLEELCHVSDIPFAVPVRVSPQNALMVNRERWAFGNSPIRDLQEFIDIFSTDGPGRLGLRSTGTSVLQLFTLILLGIEGRSAYHEVISGEIWMDVLRTISLRCAPLFMNAVWLPTNPDESDLAQCDVVLYDPHMGSLILKNQWELRTFPQTGNDVVMHGTGFCLAKRGNTPEGGERVLRTLVNPAVQDHIATEEHHIPPFRAPDSSSTSITPSRTIFEEANNTLPSISTGCGLDSDRRYALVQALDPLLAAWEDPDNMADLLGAILR